MPEYLFITPRGSGLPFFCELDPAGDPMRSGKEIRGWHVDNQGRRQDKMDPMLRTQARRVQKAMLHDTRGLVVV